MRRRRWQRRSRSPDNRDSHRRSAQSRILRLPRLRYDSRGGSEDPRPLGSDALCGVQILRSAAGIVFERNETTPLAAAQPLSGQSRFTPTLRAEPDSPSSPASTRFSRRIRGSAPLGSDALCGGADPPICGGNRVRAQWDDAVGSGAAALLTIAIHTDAPRRAGLSVFVGFDTILAADQRIRTPPE